MRQGDDVAGRYRLDELQGHGPMSEVWSAHDDTLDRTVALKILAPSADLARFRREAQSLAGLAHENIVRLYDYGEDEIGPYMALEWLPGGTLEERLVEGPLPTAEAYRVATGIAAGLAQLHARGLVHRDLKPANVLFDEEDRPKLGDFGLARRIAGAGTLTEAGTVLGTAAYISPEQAAGEPAGSPSDVYSFGVILFRMLTGALPFAAADALALANMHRYASPPAVEALQPDAPPELASLTAAALRKEPGARPADGAALLGALGGAPLAYAAGLETQPTQVLPPAAPPPPRARRKWVAVAFALALLAAAGGVMAWAVARSPTSAGPSTVPPTTRNHATTHPPTTSTAETRTGAGHRPQRTQQKPTTSSRDTTTRAATTGSTTSTRSTTTTPPTTQATTTQTATTTTPATTTTATTTTPATTTAPGLVTTTSTSGTTSASLPDSTEAPSGRRTNRSRARTAPAPAARGNRGRASRPGRAP